MNKEERNIYFENNRFSIERIVDFTIKESQQYHKMAGAYLGYKSNIAYKTIANTNLNCDDVKQRILLELFETLKKKRFVTKSYIKMLCESRLKNILRRNYLEYKKQSERASEDHSLEWASSSPDIFFSDIVVRDVIRNTLKLLDDPLEKKYLQVLSGNLGIEGYEEFAFYNTNKAESDDLCIAKSLGFDSIFRNKYRKIKKTVKITLYSVIESYANVA